MLSDRDRARSYPIVSGTPAFGEEAEPVRREPARLRQAAVPGSRARFERAVREGDLPVETDCAKLARYIDTVLNDPEVRAASGATERELPQAVAVAMRAWSR